VDPTFASIVKAFKIAGCSIPDVPKPAIKMPDFSKNSLLFILKSSRKKETASYDDNLTVS
ncbi:MAG TPA: hypothetical protein VF455_08630, partial [Chryseobacterium sp.]